MKNNFSYFFKKNKILVSLFILFLILSIFFTYLVLEKKEKEIQQKIEKEKIEKFNLFLKEQKLEKETIAKFKKEGCEIISFGEKKCEINSEDCFNFSKNEEKISCEKWDVRHLPEPDEIKSLYLTSYAALSSKKQKQIFHLNKNSEINSVVIDVKEVDGKVAFDMSDFEFGDLKAKSNKIIKNPKELIEKFHREGIYVIGRIVVFKDSHLAKEKKDWAIKTSDRKTVWKDYRGKKYLDPNNKELWEYTKNISRAMYLVGFDEINFDYIRFPSDGPLRDMWHPFSQKEIEKSEWGRVKIMDKFFNYLSSELKNEFPEIKISGDLFGYTALENSDLNIGQILENAILYFDRVSPMIYPSHYNRNFLGLKSADSNPYRVINYNMRKISEKIDSLNEKIELAKKENKKLILRNEIEVSLPREKLEKIEKEKVMVWLQGFSCTWCNPDFIYYGKNEIQAQVSALENEEYFHWFLWNASSKYKNDWFDKN